MKIILESIIGRNFDLIADTDTEKYYFRIVSATNSDKR